MKELLLECTMRQYNEIQDESYYKEATITLKDNELYLEFEGSFDAWRETYGRFSVDIEIPEEYGEIKDFYLELTKTSYVLDDFLIVENAEYKRLEDFFKLIIFKNKLDKDLNHNETVNKKIKI